MNEEIVDKIRCLIDDADCFGPEAIEVKECSRGLLTAITSAVAQARREALEEAAKAIEHMRFLAEQEEDQTLPPGLCVAGNHVHALIEKESK